MTPSQADHLQTKSFTKTYDGLTNILQTSVIVFSKPSPTFEGGETFEAIWDTGATNSAISKNVVDKLDLRPIGRTVTNTAHGPRPCNVYLVSIILPNNVGFRNIPVTEVELVSGSDLLIGMDIIAAGDFAVTNKGGVTKFAYRHPSIDHIDFVKDFKEIKRKNPAMAKGKSRKKKRRNPPKKNKNN